MRTCLPRKKYLPADSSRVNQTCLAIFFPTTLFFTPMNKTFLIFFLLLFSPGLFAGNFASIKQQAEAGDAAAQFDLATLYDVGEGVTRDVRQAAKWYRRAAEQGEVAAQYNLAIMYDMGEGVEKDIVQAYAWMAAAEMFGYQNARESSKDFLGRMTPEQQDQGEELVMQIVNRITQRNKYYPSLKPGSQPEPE